jgi:U4/U6.U5 tri-snRNP-associated protein 1
LAEEPLVKKGLGATLALLQSKGFLQKSTPEDRERDSRQKEKQKWVVEQKLKDLEKDKERERDKEKNRGGGKKDERRDDR